MPTATTSPAAADTARCPSLGRDSVYLGPMSHPPCCDRDVWSLPQLDVASFAAPAREYVNDQLPLGPAEDIATVAASLLADLEPKVARARAARDQAAWEVWRKWHVRHGANIPGAIGVQRVAWKKIRDRLDAAPPPVSMGDAALRRLPALAVVWAELAALAEAALQARYIAEDQLLAEGWTKARVARLIGRTPSRVSRRTTEAEPAA